MTVQHPSPHSSGVTAKLFEKGLRRVRQALISNASLEDVLNALIATVEEQFPDIVGSVLLLDKEERCLHHGSATGLPDDYCQAIDGLLIGPGVGSCGTAAFTKERVIVEDIQNHPYWEPFRELALQAGVHACWSQPIFSADDRVLGTFALYYRQPKAPSAPELALLEAAAEIAGIAIEMKRDADALGETEERFRALADNIPNLAWMANEEGWIYWFNKRWYEYTGTTPAEMEGWGWQSVHDPRELPRVLAGWKASIASGEPFDMVFPLRGADGEFRPFLTRVVPIKDGQGRIVQWFGTNTDISRQVETEQALRESEGRLKESEARFRTMAEASTALIWLLDAQGQLVYLNQKLLDYLGTTTERIMAENWAPYFLPEDIPVIADRLNKALAGGEPYNLEVRMWHAPSQSYRWIYTSGGLTYGADGQVTGMVGSAIDIHDRKLAEVALQESEARLRAIMEATPECIKIVAPDGTLAYMNKSGLAMIEAPAPEDVVGCACVFDVIAPEFRKEWVEQHRQVCRGESLTWEFDIIGLQGTRRRMETHAVPLPLPDGQYAQLAVTRDVTHKKQAEEDLISYATQLEQSNRELAQFATIASHDLQEPLRKVSVFSEMLKPLVAEEGKEYLGRMTSAVNRMQSLIDDLLTLSRIHRHGKPFARIDLNQAVKTVLDDLQLIIEETGATVAVEPLGAVFADRSQIRQLLQNLIGNALKYRRDNVPPVIRIYGEAVDSGQAYRTTVEDNGIGIKPEHFEKIFEPFQRLHGVGKYPGTGMGLAICRKIIERHQGSLQVESTPGEGSKFHFTLPCRGGRNQESSRDIFGEPPAE